jgi:hypothetical protein
MKPRGHVKACGPEALDTIERHSSHYLLATAWSQACPKRALPSDDGVDASSKEEVGRFA